MSNHTTTSEIIAELMEKFPPSTNTHIGDRDMTYLCFLSFCMNEAKEIMSHFKNVEIKEVDPDILPKKDTVYLVPKPAQYIKFQIEE